MTDRELAYFCYAHFIIPRSEWPLHFSIDSRKSTLTQKARRAYTRIWRSIAAAV